MALVIAADAGGQIGKPDGIVGFHHDVVGRGEALALELVGEHGDRPVMLGPRHAPRVVFAGDESALAIARVAVGEIRRRTIDARARRDLVPAQHAVVGNVAPDQAAPVAHPHRSFAPARAGVEPLDARRLDAIFGKARVERDDARIWIAQVFFPRGESGRGGERSGAGDDISA